VKNNTSFQALQSIISGEHSNGKRKCEFVIVEELVEDYQHEAKKSFAMGKVMYKKAYEQFKKAIFYCEKMEKTPENQHLLATLYNAPVTVDSYYSAQVRREFRWGGRVDKN